MNYGELKTAWAQYTHRNDIDQVVNIIEVVTSTRIGRDAKLFENEITVDINHDDPMPAGYAKARKVINTKAIPMTFLTPQQYDFMATSRRGLPTIYTIVANTFKCVSGSATMTYFQKPSKLIDDTDTNDILTAWPQLYIYGGGAEIKRWGEEDDTALEQFYLNELFKVNKEAEIGRTGDRPVMRAMGWD